MQRSRWLLLLTSVIGTLFVGTITSPNSANAGAASGGYHVGVVRCTFLDPTRSVLNYSTAPPTVLTRGRSLVTEIRYPTVGSASSSQEVAGAPPAIRVGGFPMIVFAHGYNVTPDTYAALLDSWVARGFVVAAPFFPDENSAAVALQHYANTERDLLNEPADLAFVTRQIVQDSTTMTQSCPMVNGLIDPTALALAGHSDGGEAVAMLSNSLGQDPQGAAFPSLGAGLAYKAVIVMSGAEDGGGLYRASAKRPDLLVVQSAIDTCNPAVQSLRLYRDIGQNNKWFLELLHAHHLPPYDGADIAAFTVVSGVTVRFLQRALEPVASTNFVAFANSQPILGRLIHAGWGPTILPLKTPPHCGFN